MNTFKKYIKKYKLSANRFANENGLTQPACRRALLGFRMSPEIAYQITLATNLEVDFLTLIFPNKKKEELKEIIPSILNYT